MSPRPKFTESERKTVTIIIVVILLWLIINEAGL